MGSGGVRLGAGRKPPRQYPYTIEGIPVRARLLGITDAELALVGEALHRIYSPPKTDFKTWLRTRTEDGPIGDVSADAFHPDEPAWSTPEDLLALGCCPGYALDAAVAEWNPGYPWPPNTDTDEEGEADGPFEF